MSDPRTILPQNASPLEVALDKNMATRFDYSAFLGSQWSAEDCPSELLPFLAWALSVDVWDSDWPDHVKRQVVKSSAYVHRFKGTAAGIKAALDALDLGISLSEWFEHGGDPFTFKADVVLTTRGLTDQEYQNIVDVIAATKNARSHLSALRVYLTSQGFPFFAAMTVIGERIDVQPWVATVPPTEAAPHFAVVTQIAETVTTGESHV